MISSPYSNSPNKNNEENEELLLKKEYKINYLEEIITISIGKTKNYIVIRSSFYEIKLNIDNLLLLIPIKFKSINEAFKFIQNIFEQNKFKIKGISSNNLILIIIIYDTIKGREKEIELNLNQNLNNDFIIKDLFKKYIQLEKDINDLKKENIKLKKEINDLKNNQNYNDNNNIYNPMNQILMNQMGLQMPMDQMLMNNHMNPMNQMGRQMPMDQMLMNQMSMNNHINPMNQMNPMNLNNNLTESYLDSINKNNFNYMNTNSNFFNSNLDNINEEFQKWSATFIPIYNQKEKRIDTLPTIVEFVSNDLISEIVDKYREKSDDKRNNLKFIVDGRALEMNLTAREAGLSNNANIYVLQVKCDDDESKK